MWRVLRALVAGMDLGGMGPLVARALEPRRMSLAKKDVAEYAGVAVPLYELWARRHEFLLRRQQKGETVEEYFRAKRGLLAEGDTYGDMMAAYPAYWSCLRSGELVVLMDTRVLGSGWACQVMGRDPQIEEWAAGATPNVGALQQLLSTLDDQRGCGRRYGLSAGMGTEARERRRTLVQNPGV